MATPRMPSYYRGRSHRFLALVDDVLEWGELEMACETLWGAAAHAIKAVAAQRRGWEHNTHNQLRIAIDRLVSEEGAPTYLLGQYHIASRFHEGFYGRPFDADQIRNGKEPIAEFIRALESLPDPQP